VEYDNTKIFQNGFQTHDKPIDQLPQNTNPNNIVDTPSKKKVILIKRNKGGTN
jgi:hypothetical protein